MMDSDNGLGPLNSFVLVGITIAIYTVAKVTYNIFLHPLAKFPGPWWARWSYLPEFYYDVIQGGRYFKQIASMHDKYDELHLNDPYFYSTVYCSSAQKRNRSKKHVAVAGTSHALNTTIDHDLHRQRRGYISSFFSKQSIAQLQPFVQTKIDKLIQKLNEAYERGDTVIGVQAFGALTTDIITHYAYGQSFGNLDIPGFSCPLARDVSALLHSSHFRRFLPRVNKLMQKLPEWLVEKLNPAAGTFIAFQRDMTKLCSDALQLRESKSWSPTNKTLFDMLISPNIPESERSLERVRDESQLILLAGLDTTARVLTAMVCFWETYPDTLAKLRAELRTLGLPKDAKPTWSQLEALPYLTAVINETLRCHGFMTDRFPRVAVEPLQYKDMVIPAMTPIGAMPWLINRHPDVFPDPDTFRPERWLEAEARGDHLPRYLVTFSKGSKICLGINLAYLELYLAAYALATTFDFELVDSSIENIIPARDFSLAFDENYQYGVNFRVTKVLEN